MCNSKILSLAEPAHSVGMYSGGIHFLQIRVMKSKNKRSNNLSFQSSQIASRYLFHLNVPNWAQMYSILHNHPTPKNAKT